MATHIVTASQSGYDATIVDVECDLHTGLPSISIVGLGNKAVDEAKERVRSAIQNTGLEFPRKRTVINLAPADTPKDGSSYDVPIAIAILCANRQLNNNELLQTSAFIGELALDGNIRPVKGIISLVEAALRAKAKRVFIPYDNRHQALLVDGIDIIPVKTLAELLQLLAGHVGRLPISQQPSDNKHPIHVSTGPDFAEVRGQDIAKRALMIAAAGHHNILLNGSPGAGKTMMAKALMSIMPPPSNQEIVEITKIHSLAGENTTDIMTTRPFRAPHHTTSSVALVGGGRLPLPGEISLAHNGVLFLDELPEYPRHVLESLRQPLEDHLINIARAHLKTTFPARFMLVATQNPCPCGFLYDKTKQCTCTANQIQQYHKKLSGPLLDRIDLTVFVNKIDHSKLLEDSLSLSSADMYSQVKVALLAQVKRFGTTSDKNAYMTNKQIKQCANLDEAAKELLDKSAEKINLSARSYLKTLKVARTIADLESSEKILMPHIAEALQYRLQK